jgi:hypothetical protein
MSPERKYLPAPAGCCDDNDPLLSMARYMIHCAFKEALIERSSEHVAVVVMGMARTIAIELLVDRGMTRHQAKQLVDDRTRMVQAMTDQMAKEAGLM